MFESDDAKAAVQPQADDIGKAFSMAAEIFASSNSAAPPSQPEPKAQPDAEMSKDEIAGMLLELLSKQTEPDTPPSSDAEAPPPVLGQVAAQTSEQGSPSPPGLSSIASALPPIMQALSGKGEFIKPEKLNLIKALKPYMSATRGDSIERAIRMANIAQATKSALTALGR